MPCLILKALCKADLFNAKVNSEDFFLLHFRIILISVEFRDLPLVFYG